LLPDQPPLAVQLEALWVNQLSVTDCPGRTEEGVAANLISGTGVEESKGGTEGKFTAGGEITGGALEEMVTL